MIKQAFIFLLLPGAIGMSSSLARTGRCEVIDPPPKSKDCKEHDTCFLPDGQRGYCSQVYNHVGSKCLVCNPVSANFPE